MRLEVLAEELTEARKMQKGIGGKFKERKLADGKRVMTFVDSVGRTYVIRNSIENFLRFEKWDKKEAIADIQKTYKKVKLDDGDRVPAIKIRVDVKLDKEDEEKKDEIANEDYI
jgi:hypothetical protein